MHTNSKLHRNLNIILVVLGIVWFSLMVSVVYSWYHPTPVNVQEGPPIPWDVQRPTSPVLKKMVVRKAPLIPVVFTVIQHQPPTVVYLTSDQIPTTFIVYWQTNPVVPLTNWAVLKQATNVAVIPVGNTGRTNYYYAKTISTNISSNITIAWNPSRDPTVVGYEIYYGGKSNPGGLDNIYTNITILGNVTNLLITGLVGGVTYYIAATDYNSFGVQSIFSEEISYTVAYTPPVYSMSPNNPYWPPFTNLTFTLTATNPASGGKFTQTNLAFNVLVALTVKPASWQQLVKGTGSVSYAVSNLPLYAPQAFFRAKTVATNNIPKILRLLINGQ